MKKAIKLKISDTVAIKRIQYCPGLKLKQKYSFPYKAIKVKNNDSYDVQKIVFTEIPMVMGTCAEYMKP